MKKEEQYCAELNGRLLKRVSVITAVMAGAMADGYLRLVSGDEGNLLVHSVLFLLVTVVVAGTIYGIVSLNRRLSCN